MSRANTKPSSKLSFVSEETASGMPRFLSQYKHGLHWTHLLLTYGLLLSPIGISLFHRGSFSLTLTAAIFTLALLGFCQNIGLMHQHFHRFPKGPPWLTELAVFPTYWLGGLNFWRGRLAHLLHHAHLGTEKDPDRLGYTRPIRVGQRLLYLFLIGPLRAKFAPVDIETAGLRKMTDTNRAQFTKKCRKHSIGIVATQLSLLSLLGWYYLPWFFALLTANLLSNIREMAEHGNRGKAAFVNVRVSPIGLVLFSNLGFWYHGTHHRWAEIHYFDLPLEARRRSWSGKRALLTRSSYLSYLFRGK